MKKGYIFAGTVLLIFVLCRFCFGILAPFDKLDFSAEEVKYMELYSEGMDIKTAISDYEDIERLIDSINSSRSAGIRPALWGSSVPPYGILFYFKDGRMEEFRFIPKEYDRDAGTAVMDRMSERNGGIGKGMFRGDLFYVFWDLVAENNSREDVQEFYSRYAG